MIYTGIGARATPVEQQERLSRIAQILASRGHRLRSGAAPGADTAFEMGHTSIKETDLQIFIPWKSFVKELKNYHVFYLPVAVRNESEKIAAQTHPNWNACSDAVKKLHARNVNQILGDDLNVPSDFVICWTADGRASGGSATAINLAESYNIPVFNLNSLPFKTMTAMQFVLHLSKTLTKPI